MIPRAGDRKSCNLTRGPDENGVTRNCKGRLIPEETPTPAQAAQRVVTGLFVAARAVTGARRISSASFFAMTSRESRETWSLSLASITS